MCDLGRDFSTWKKKQLELTAYKIEPLSCKKSE